MEQRLSSFFLKHSYRFFSLSILFCVFSIIGLKYGAFDADPRLYFSDDNPRFQLNQSLEERYGRVNQVTMAIEFQDGDIYTPKNLAIIEQLTADSWKLPYVKRVDSVANYAYSWSEDDELYVEELIENALSLSSQQVERIRHIANADDAIVNRLVSTTAPIAIIQLNAALNMGERIKQESKLAEDAAALVKRYETENPHIDILLSGNVISNTVTNAEAIKESTKIIPLMYLMIFGLLALLLRSFFAVLGIALLTMLSVASTLGLAFHMGIVINLLSITAINIIVTVSIAHCVHIYVYFLKAYRSGESKISALRESYRINMQPIFLTSFTTALGFLSMNFSDMPPAHDLGNVTAMGVAVAFFLSLAFLPAAIRMMPISNKPTKSFSHPLMNIDRLAEAIIKHKHKVGVISILISVVFLSLAPLNVVNDKFTENLKEPHPFRYDNDKLDKHFGGLYTIEFDFKAAPGKTISDPEYLQALDKFSQWLREHEQVKNVQTYSDIIKRLNRNMHDDDPAYYKIPDSQEEAAQYLLLYELSQPFGSDLNNIIQPDKLASRLVVNIPSFDSVKVIALREEIKSWVDQNMPTYMRYSGESLAVMWVFLGADAFYSSMKGSLFALLLISVVLTLVFKSIRYGFISLIPNLLPAGIGYGAWFLVSGNLDMSQMMVLSITIGIVVDDTVHFLSKYIRAKKELKTNAEDAVRYAFKHVGAPLWITTVVLVAGFSLFITSSFQPNSNLGILTAFILVSALALDFLLLPPLLMWLDKKRSSSNA